MDQRAEYYSKPSYEGPPTFLTSRRQRGGFLFWRSMHDKTKELQRKMKKMDYLSNWMKKTRQTDEYKNYAPERKASVERLYRKVHTNIFNS